jgi:hypothetical protein
MWAESADADRDAFPGVGPMRVAERATKAAAQGNPPKLGIPSE